MYNSTVRRRWVPWWAPHPEFFSPNMMTSVFVSRTKLPPEYPWSDKNKRISACDQKAAWVRTGFSVNSVLTAGSAPVSPPKGSLAAE